MRQFALPIIISIILLLTVSLCNIAANGNTIELPRQKGSASAIKTEKVDDRYRILTSRYEITAPCSESGKQAGERLEHLFEAIQLLFGKDFQPAEPMQDRMRVVIYRDKEEYHGELVSIEPRIAMTNGFYFAPGKTMYLYSPETKVLFHEGTHQILLEHFFPGQTPPFYNNFWAVEGIALFMETLQIENEHYKAGNIRADRLFSARIYQFERNYNLPIRKLTAMSAADIQASSQRQQIYSQSATFFHWLMFAEKGIYRKALPELLRRTYLGTALPETLRELTGLSCEELDTEYLKFLKTVPE